MDARLPDACCGSVVSLLPMQELPGRQGGRPVIPHSVVLNVIWFVLTVGCRWKDIPREFGCCGETARRRLKHWQEMGVWQNVHLRLLAMLRQRGCLSESIVLIDSTHVRAFGGGDRSGPSPVDRRKPGTKLTLLTDLRGTPLVLRSSPANSSDHQEILPTVAKYPSIGGLPGRPRQSPDLLFADAGYDSQATRRRCRLAASTPPSVTATDRTVRIWAVTVGPSNAPSAGSRACDAFASATTATPL